MPGGLCLPAARTHCILSDYKDILLDLAFPMMFLLRPSSLAHAGHTGSRILSYRNHTSSRIFSDRNHTRSRLLSYKNHTTPPSATDESVSRSGSILMTPSEPEDKTFRENGTIKMVARNEIHLGAALRELLKDPHMPTATRSLTVMLDLMQRQADYTYKKVENTTDFYKELLPVLHNAPQLVELRVRDFKRIDAATKLALRKSTFTNITALNLQAVAEAALLIAACPKLETLTCSYPSAKVKTTLSTILSHPSIVNLELHCKAWTASKFANAVKYVSPKIKHLAFSGEIRTTITDGLMPALRNHLETSTLEKLEVTTNPWVDYKYYEKHWFDDRLLDAIDYAKEHSPCNEDGMDVAAELFAACNSLQSITLAAVHECKTTRYTVTREEDFLDVASEDDVDMPIDYKVFPTYVGDSWHR
jgi:hypothetical protein